MRDRSTRRPVTNPQSRTWTPERVQMQHWRQHHRGNVLQELADGAHGLGWTRALLTTLLEELHITDEFDRLVGPTSRVPASQYPRLIAIALLLRHSWSLFDLSRTGKRLGLGVGPLEAELNNFGCQCSRRRRRSSRAPLSGPRPH
jgi:hypothetical protein